MQNLNFDQEENKKGITRRDMLKVVAGGIGGLIIGAVGSHLGENLIESIDLSLFKKKNELEQMISDNIPYQPKLIGDYSIITNGISKRGPGLFIVQPNQVFPSQIEISADYFAVSPDNKLILTQRQIATPLPFSSGQSIYNVYDLNGKQMLVSSQIFMKTLDSSLNPKGSWSISTDGKMHLALPVIKSGETKEYMVLNVLDFEKDGLGDFSYIENHLLGDNSYWWNHYDFFKNPQVSFDGTIVVQVENENISNLLWMGYDKSNAKVLASDVTEFAVSPDGMKVAYVKRDSQNAISYIPSLQDAQNGNWQNLPLISSYSEDKILSELAWSKDSQKLAFSQHIASKRGSSQINYVILDTKEHHNLNEETAGVSDKYSFSPFWSPDSKWLGWIEETSNNSGQRTRYLVAENMEIGASKTLLMELPVKYKIGNKCQWL